MTGLKMKKKTKRTIFNARLDKVGFIEAQGLPWETRSKVTSSEGAPAFRDVVPGRLVSGRPPGMSKRQRVECFRAPGDKPKTQGKPWAKLSRPFGPEPFAHRRLALS